MVLWNELADMYMWRYFEGSRILRCGETLLHIFHAKRSHCMLPLLSIKNFSGDKEDRGGQQTIPEPSNTVFSTKATHCKMRLEDAIKNPITPHL